MKTIEYKIVTQAGDVREEIVRVEARDINSGFPKALKRWRETHIVSARYREIVRVEFWRVLSWSDLASPDELAKRDAIVASLKHTGHTD